MTETEEQKSARLMAELESYVTEEQASFDDVKEVLTQLSKQFETLDVLGVAVKMRPTFPKKARRMMEFLVANKDEIELLEGKAYEILAAMSMEVPWSNPKTWELIDEEHGVVFELLEALYDGIGKKEKAIAAFRPRS